MSISNNDDVFGMIFHADRMESELVILKSKAIASLIADGMSEDEAYEFYDYNVSGAYGDCSYSCVDDTLTQEEIAEMLDGEDGDEIVNPPFTGRGYNKKVMAELLAICESDASDDEKVASLHKAIIRKLT